MEEQSAPERIQKAREHLGLSAEQVAERLQLPVAWYHDLESYPDEVVSNISLAHLQLLGDILGLDPRHILLGETSSPPKVQGEFQDVSTGLNRKMAAEGLDVETMGEMVGWDVREVLIDSHCGISLSTDFAIFAGLQTLIGCPCFQAYPDNGGRRPTIAFSPTGLSRRIC